MDRRFKCYRDQKKLKIEPPEIESNSGIYPNPFAEPFNVVRASSPYQVTRRVSRELANLQMNGSRVSSISRTQTDSKPILSAKSTATNDVKLSHRRNLINDFAPVVKEEPKEIKVKSAISNSRRNSLLDINGQPRKSPREHASTLAILSCLVRERKKREKELNGGISPDKVRLNDDDREQTSDGSYGDEAYDTGVLTAVIKQEVDSTIIKQEVESCDEDVESNVFQSMPSSAVTNIKCEQIDETTTTVTKNEPVESNEPTEEDVTEDFKPPKMPPDNYVNPFRLYRQIDNFLHSSYGDDYYSDVPISVDDSKDLILIGARKDFVEVMLSTTPGPLRYRSLVNPKKATGLSSFSRNKKRRNNKTGWPTLPKRRITVKKEVEEDSCSNASATEQDDQCELNQTTNEDRVDISDQLENCKDEFFIRSRQKLNSMGDDFSKDDGYSNDGNNSFLFPGTSDKAGYSAIFTVSSDSLDTDVTESNNKQQLDKDYDVISMKNIVNVSDEDSADVTLAEMLKKQIGVGQKMVRCNRPKAVKKSNKIANNVKLLQPIIYVKKINESESLNKFMTNKKNSPIKEEPIVRNNSSPNTKCSPRKLRKPRGRWYRER